MRYLVIVDTNFGNNHQVTDNRLVSFLKKTSREFTNPQSILEKSMQILAR